MAYAGPIPIDLGTAGSFAVLAGSTVTNTGSTTISGNLGVWPGTSVTGFQTGGMVVNGSIYAGDTTAQTAQADLTTAYNAAADQSGGQVLANQNLGGLILTPGTYVFSSAAQINGMLTLNAEGDPNAEFLFQIGSSLITASGSDVSIINGGSGNNVFWQVGSSATLGTTSTFDGSILAKTSITLDTGADISCGRALAENGAVTLQGNTVSTGAAACNSSAAKPVPEPASLLVLAAGLLTLPLSHRCRALGRSRPIAP